jgi:hypothetical protein
VFILGGRGGGNIERGGRGGGNIERGGRGGGNIERGGNAIKPGGGIKCGGITFGLIGRPKNGINGFGFGFTMILYSGILLYSGIIFRLFWDGVDKFDTLDKSDTLDKLLLK